MQFALACALLAAMLASLVNINQTNQISDLKHRTKALESALKAYNIPITEVE